MNAKEYLLKSFTFTKGFLYGFVGMMALPRTTFDKIAIAYYDFLEPETIGSPNNENILPPTEKK